MLNRIEKIQVFLDNEIEDKGQDVALGNYAEAFAATVDRIVRGEVAPNEDALHDAFYAELELRAFGGM